jgi:hypothetical protein
MQNIEITKNTIEFCITNIPVVNEDTLKWEQVKDFKIDEESVRRLRRFRCWMYDLNGKSEHEIINRIVLALEEYRSALKKHGINFKISSISTIFSAGVTLYSFLDKNIISAILGGLSLISNVLVYAIKDLSEYYTIRNHPIAFLHDIQQGI